MRLDLILRVATKLILPFMLVFALYVQFHGDYSAGGGFQGGSGRGGGSAPGSWRSSHSRTSCGSCARSSAATPA